MAEKNLYLKSVTVLFKKEHQDVLQKLQELDESINNLQYEGKVFFGKNAKAIEKAVQFLKKKLFEHIEVDEGVIFPYVQVHVPKLYPMLCFLRAERNEFKLSIKNFELLSKQLRAEKNELRQQKIIDQIKQKGIYAICLMRNHIQIELESVYKPLDRELHLNEKKELVTKCLKYRLKIRPQVHVNK